MGGGASFIIHRKGLAGQVREPATARALRDMGIKANDQEQGQGFGECKKGKPARLIVALALAVEGRREKGEEGAEAQFRRTWYVWRPCPLGNVGWAHGRRLTRDRAGVAHARNMWASLIL